MSAGRALALTVAASALLMTFSAAATAQNGAARLEGTFTLSGRVTVAVHIKAEHRGQRVARVWSFTPLCPTGACADVLLSRQRLGGTDTLTLHSVSPGNYRGQSAFTAPLGCNGRLQPSGETARFTITVRVTAASGSSDGLIATDIRATYTNRLRSNNTRCVLPPSRDAAVYQGSLQTMTPTTVGPATSARLAAGARHSATAQPALSGLSLAGS